MIARTRMPSFFGEIAVGFAVSLVAAAVVLTLSFVLPAAVVWRLVIAGLGLTLILRTLARSDEKTGRIVTLVAWLVAAASLWLTGVGLASYVTAHVALVWLVRSLFVYSRLIEAGLDLALTLLALSFAVFAAVRTESIFLSTWCFFLVQALHVSIPGFTSRLTAPRERDVPASDPNRGFADAFKAADEALQRIAGQR